MKFSGILCNKNDSEGFYEIPRNSTEEKWYFQEFYRIKMEFFEIIMKFWTIPLKLMEFPKDPTEKFNSNEFHIIEMDPRIFKHPT